MIIKSNLLIFVFMVISSFFISQINSQQDFQINQQDQQGYQQEYQQESNYQQNQFNNQQPNRQPTQQQMQYFSQRRTACLVLSRYYLNQYSQSINQIVKDLTQQDQQKFINKLYSTAVQKCQPIIAQMEVIQFFTPNQQFDPSSMYHIFDGYNFYQATQNLQQMTPNQKSIVKFIKQFDAQMEVRKQQQEAKKMQQQRDQGIQVFFISIKNLPPQIKYLYIVIVMLISGAIVWYGFNQIGQKPQKKDKKKKKQN